MGERVHLARGAQDQQAQHLGLCGQLDERPLDRLVHGEGSPEDGSGFRVRDALIDAEFGGAAARGRLPDPVLVREGLGDGEAGVGGAEDGGCGDEDVGEEHRCVVGRHVEGPFVGLDGDAGRAGGDDEGGDAVRGARLPRGAREEQHVGCRVHPCLPFLVPADGVAGFAAGEGAGRGHRVHVRGVGAVVDFSQAEGRPEGAVQARGDVLGALLWRAEVVQHQHVGEVADDAVLVLQVVGEAQPAAVDGVRGQVVPDRAHVQVEVRVRGAAELGGQREAVEARGVGEGAGFGEEGFPGWGREALVGPLGPG